MVLFGFKGIVQILREYDSLHRVFWKSVDFRNTWRS